VRFQETVADSRFPVRTCPCRSSSARYIPGRYGDGGGLYLEIRREGNKSWAFRYMIDGKARELGLGPLHSVSLAEARVRAREARQVILGGRDPIDSRRAARAEVKAAQLKTITFSEAVGQFLATAKIESFQNTKHRKQWRSTLQSVFPVMGSLPLQQIDTAAILAALLPIWRKTPETGSRLRGRIARVFDCVANAKVYNIGRTA
jgi:Arm DNA-binding domain